MLGDYFFIKCPHHFAASFCHWRGGPAFEQLDTQIHTRKKWKICSRTDITTYKHSSGAIYVLSTSFCTDHCQTGVQGRVFALLEDMNHCCLGDQARRKCARCDIDGTGIHKIHRLFHEHLWTRIYLKLTRALTTWLTATAKMRNASIRIYFSSMLHLLKIGKSE